MKTLTMYLLTDQTRHDLIFGVWLAGDQPTDQFEGQNYLMLVDVIGYSLFAACCGIIMYLAGLAVWRIHKRPSAAGRRQRPTARFYFTAKAATKIAEANKRALSAGCTQIKVGRLNN